MGNTLEKSRSV